MDALLDEVESLEAILMDDVRIERSDDDCATPRVIETTVFPLVDEDGDQQYVCVTLQVHPGVNYPEVSPEFKLLRPRGLDDARLSIIRTACEHKLKESLGYPVVFDLIEVIREHLTGSNLPSGQCVICLYGFCDGDEFTRTECFHYLHSYCLGRHLTAMRRNYQEEYNKLPAWQQKTAESFQPVCPVCREPIKDEEDSLRCAMPPTELENAPDFHPTQELRELQQRMSVLFLQQKSRGAIIDTEMEAAPVISIESEADIRRRLQQRKQRALESNATLNNSNLNHVSEQQLFNRTRNSPDGAETASSNDSPKNEDVSGAENIGDGELNENSDLPSRHHHHYHRRHFKGGRRHQHHHHYHLHHQNHQNQEQNQQQTNSHGVAQTQRERERFEHHHIPAATASAASTSVATGKGGNTSDNHQINSKRSSAGHKNSGNNKQPKSHSNNHHQHR